jgi:hypothetical protein
LTSPGASGIIPPMECSFKLGHFRVPPLVISGLLLLFLCCASRAEAGEEKGKPATPREGSGAASPAGAETLPPGVSGDDAEKVRELLVRWREAWERKDLETYLACYASRFTFSGGGMAEFRAYKRGVFAKPGRVVVTVSGVTMRKEGDFIVVGFRQDYQTPGHRDSGTKELYLARENGAWHIIREEWRREK